jgi:hypothetical protein
MNNPYFELIENVLKGSIDFKYSTLRSSCVSRFSFAIPNVAAIHTIAKYSPMVEIGAGTGYWAKLLAEANTNIMCFDIAIDNNNEYCDNTKWYPVHEGNEYVLTKMHTSINLLLSWPPWKNQMALNCLKLFKGKYVIYIGEDRRGCTGTEEFFEELNIGWENIDYCRIPNWRGIHDAVYIYKRKERR